MYKSAYIMKTDGMHGAGSRKTYRTETGIAMIACVDNEDSGKQLVIELVREGYKKISLGYGFTEEDAERIRDSEEFQAPAEAAVKIRCVSYTINEYAKLKKTGMTRSHGVIMAVPGVDRAAALFLSGESHDIRAVFVKDITQAKHAARYLVKHNAGFIELCIWFDRFRMEDVIQAVGGAVPVGTCGDLNMQDLEPETETEIEELLPKKRVYKRRK